MKLPRTPASALAAALLALPALSATPAQAQSALPKAITFVVPQNAGGSNDLMARAIATRLPKFVDATVVVENKPGAGGNLGSAWVARSAPRDGTPGW